MPDPEKEAIIEVVHGAVEAAINKRIVSAMFWLVAIGVANFAAVVGVVVTIQNFDMKMNATVGDRWTGTMEDVAELHRDRENPNYNPVHVRDIQTKYKP